MNHYSIDIETLGTNFNDTILSIGICKFNPISGEILDTLEVTFDILDNNTINCNLGTIKFWLQQAVENFEAVAHVFYAADKVDYVTGLEQITNFIEPDSNMWANGTKFDLGMVEQLYKDVGIEQPWRFNADRCMRTLRMLFGKVDINMDEYKEVAHTALSDSIWQAKYIAHCLNQLEQKGIIID